MSKIRLLDEQTIQKIAAGEVIERPASVVKELMENSFDANAKNIVVETKSGGKKLLRILDDGTGIAEEDLELAFCPHATSKLTNIEDLYQIGSYGFRGEALASISQVSRISLISKTIEQLTGFRLSVEEGKIVRKEEIAFPVGTQIEVKDLFYNMPVRRNFLKSDASENNALSDAILKAALSKPGVAVKYIRDEKTVFHATADQTMEERIYTLLGKDFCENLIFFEEDFLDIRISGAFSNNRLYRGLRTHQYLFVNGRPIYSAAISKAVENIYKSLIPLGKFPCFVFFIDIPPSEIDVNIHPNKKEIKFLNSDALIRILVSCIQKKIQYNTRVETASLFNEKSEKKELFVKSDERSEESGSDIIYKDYTSEETLFSRDFSSSSSSKEISSKEISKKEDFMSTIEPKELLTKVIGVMGEDASEKVEKLIKTEILPEEPTDCDRATIPAVRDEVVKYRTEEPKDKSFLSSEKNIPEIILLLKESGYVASVFKTYLIFENSRTDSLLLLDQHAAHERILYEKFSRAYREEKIECQRLLEPQIISLSDGDKSMVMSHLDELNGMGFEIEDFGGTEIMLRGLPILFGQVKDKNFFINILDSMQSGRIYEFNIEKIMKKSCVNAVKAGYVLREGDVEKIIEELEKCEMPETCPHGRPIVVQVQRADFARVFLRS